MSDTTCHMSISLDGFVAGPDQSIDNPLGKRGRELHGRHIGDPRATDADRVATDWLMRFDGFDPFDFEPVEVLRSLLTTHIRYRRTG